MSDVNLYEQSAQHLSQEQCILEYAPLVKRIAMHLHNRLPAHIVLDDLLQVGMMGLIEANKNYDPTQNTKFESFAGYRIRGAMMDELRRQQWLPRSAIENSKKIMHAIRFLELEKYSQPSSQEIAKTLDVSLDEYHQMLMDINANDLISFDGHDPIESEHAKPAEAALKHETHVNLSRFLKHLPEKEQLVVALYYDEELNFKEIGHILDVSESRVSQLHAQAVARLKVKMNAIDTV